MSERSYSVDEFSNRAARSDPFYEAICRSMVAVVRGNGAEAIRQIELAIDGFVAIGDVQGEGRARSKATIVFRRAGNAQRVIAESERALACFKRRPDPGYAAAVYLELGQLAVERRDDNTALAHYQAGLDLVGKPVAGEEEVVANVRAFLCDLKANCLAPRREWDEVRVADDGPPLQASKVFARSISTATL